MEAYRPASIRWIRKGCSALTATGEAMETGGACNPRQCTEEWGPSDEGERGAMPSDRSSEEWCWRLLLAGQNARRDCYSDWGLFPHARDKAAGRWLVGVCATWDLMSATYLALTQSVADQKNFCLELIAAPLKAHAGLPPGHCIASHSSYTVWRPFNFTQLFYSILKPWQPKRQVK
jgi:hypothetical protein